jgi:CheY-like chemotaxis protein
VKPVILVVDDNPANLKLAYWVLSETFDVRQAESAEEALAQLSVALPDLLLLDLALPGMDGLELARLIRANPRLQSVPIVALTAFAMKGDAEKAFAAGCDDYITKPIDTRTLPARLHQLIERSWSRR